MSDPYRHVTITEAEYQQLLADREDRDTIRAMLSHIRDMLSRLAAIGLPREPINAIPMHQNRVQPQASAGSEPESGVPASPDR